jgi:hypothetical protein
MKTIVLIPLLAIGITAFAQDPVKISPQFYKLLLENDQVRVLEYRLKPGEKELAGSGHAFGRERRPNGSAGYRD